MARSKNVTISVKVPVKWEAMTDRSRQKLRQIVGRDKRVIRAFLGVIEQHEDELLTGKNRIRIDEGALDRLTMTALKVKSGKEQRPTVKHDFKVRFPRMSQNEMAECRQTAVGMYESYLRLRQKRGYRASRPCAIAASRRIPRWVFSQRFRLYEERTKVSRYWLDLRDSLDSAPDGKRVHDRLLIPLKGSPFHENQFARGEVKALQIFTDRERKWWITFAVRIEESSIVENGLPVAVLGIDLGIEKSACATLVTPTRVRETTYFVQKEKVQSMRKLDLLVGDLQREMDTRRNNGQPRKKLAETLRNLGNKRERVAKEYDRALVHQLVEYIGKLSEKYTLYVALGKVKNIRVLAKKGNRTGKSFRGMIHRWAFARITKMLSHQLSQLGWSVDGKNSRFRAVPESWTSIMCWKCGRKGVRPKQSLFVCPTCGNKCNADQNGAINIAGRLITLTASLHPVRGLGKWARAVQAAKRSSPKARGKKSSSRRKSLLSKKDQASGQGESAAVHQAQSSLLDFGDKVEMGDNDPAVGKTVETLSVVGSDASTTRQEKETRTVGGISSQ